MSGDAGMSGPAASRVRRTWDEVEGVGCLAASTRVRLAGGAAEMPLGQLATNGAGRVPIWTLDRVGQPVVGEMAKAFFAGVRPTFVLGFASGVVLEATANHPFLSMDGWLRVDELALGDRIASVTGPAWDVVLGWNLLTMIERYGSQPVYDLTIAGTHNFVANGVVVHNSSPPPVRRHHGVTAAETGGQRGGIRIT